MRKFTGLDTETQDGRAVLIATPDRHLLFPRSWQEICEFLAVDDAYVCFNLDYDVRGILKFLRARDLRALALFGRVVTREGYRLRYLPRKVFSVAQGKRTLFSVYDCYQFFQTSLEVAASKILGEHKEEIPSSWLQKMAICLSDPKRRERVISYCRHDALLAERLQRHVGEQFEALGVSFDRPLSAGSLAVSRFKERLKFRIPPWQNEHHRRIYYGGRIETFRRGTFRDCYRYDISSAYPYTLSTLIHPDDCRVIRHARYTEGAVYGIYRVKVYVPSTEFLSPVPYDLLGWQYDPLQLTYPAGLWELWTDRYTLGVLLHYGFLRDLYYAVEWLPETDRLWFPEIPELYAERSRRPEVALAIKLLLNSIYGKLAERRPLYVEGDVCPDSIYHDGRWRNRVEQLTTHTSFLVAAHVTAATRAKLYRTVKDNPQVRWLLCATDGLASEGPAGIEEEPGLGRWKLEMRCEEMIVVGAGVYAYRQGDRWTTKWRGYHTDRTLPDLLCGKKRTTVTVPVLVGSTLLDCVKRGDLENLNVLVKERRYLNVNFDRKRFWEKDFVRAEDVLAEQHESRPLIGSNVGAAKARDTRQAPR